MTVSADVMRQARRFRIELVLLGMALAKPGDREKILSDTKIGTLNSELVSLALISIRDRDFDGVRKIMKHWGVDIGSDALEAIIEKVNSPLEAGDV